MYSRVRFFERWERGGRGGGEREGRGEGEGQGRDPETGVILRECSMDFYSGGRGGGGSGGDFQGSLRCFKIYVRVRREDYEKNERFLLPGLTAW